MEVELLHVAVGGVGEEGDPHVGSRVSIESKEATTTTHQLLVK